MKRLLKRLLYFFSGTLLLVFMVYYTLKTLRTPQLYGYILELENYNIFPYIHYVIVGSLFLMSLIFLILAFKPSHSSKKLSWETQSGKLEISKKAIESYIIKSISHFDHIRLHKITTSLKSRRNVKSIRSDIKILWLPSGDSSEASLEEINDYIKSKLEEFTKANVEEIKLNVIDQAKTDKRVV